MLHPHFPIHFMNFATNFILFIFQRNTVIQPPWLGKFPNSLSRTRFKFQSKNLSFFLSGLLRYSTSMLVLINQFFTTQTMTTPNFACSSISTSRLSSLAAVISACSLGPSSWTFRQFALQIHEKCS